MPATLSHINLFFWLYHLFSMLNLKDAALLRHQAFINGVWVSAHPAHTFPVINPATQEPIALVADCAEEETRQAILAAQAALPNWRSKTALYRAQLLLRWRDLILENLDDLAYLLTLEQGKPLTEAKAEIKYGASFIDWFAAEGQRIYGDIIPAQTPGLRLLVTKQPVGVVGAITPWNFPVAMVTRKVAPALAAACTVILKPSEETPLSALALAELAHRAGIPSGVLNVVTGKNPEAIGKTLTESPLVRKLSFTGSTAVGKHLLQQCANTVKKVSLELGGNAPFIVFDDADLDDAVQGAIQSKFRNAGQTCVCANRFFVQKNIYPAFLEKLTEAARQLKLGDGCEPNTQIGPLINQKALLKITNLVSDATQKGAKIHTGGNPLTGFFFEPTVLSDITSDMEIYNTEIFGPVAAISVFDTEADVIQRANDTTYGLAAYFYGRDIGRVFRVAEALEYGMVGVNIGVIGTAAAPFGGMKESGIGREGSKYGIDGFLEIKYTCIAGV